MVIRGAAAAATLLREIPEAARRASRRFSRVNGDFLDYVVAHPELLERSSFSSIDVSSPLQYFRLQPWPTFLSPQLRTEIHRVNLGLTRLIRQIPRRLFANDPHRLRDFYGLDDGEAEPICTLLEGPEALDATLARGDLILTETGFQCLECNLTGNLGGENSDRIAALCLAVPALEGFFESTGVVPMVRDTSHLVLVHIIRRTLALGFADSGEVNLARLTPPTAKIDERVVEYARQKYRAALDTVDPDLRGEILLVPFSGLEVSRGRLACHGQVVHAVTEGYLDRYPPEIVDRAVAGDALFFNGPVPRVLDDKRNLALLSEAAADGALSESESELVDRHVPWSRLVRYRPTSFRGRQGAVPEILLASPEDFILKPAKALGGKGIVFGAVASREEWKLAVDRALREGAWMAQELIESVPLPYQADPRGCEIHEVVWGPFVIGDSYGGGYLRMKPKDRPGPINHTSGGVVGLMLEAPE